MKITLKEFEERNLSIDGDGRITDENGNEYREENGESCQLDERRYKVEIKHIETYIVDVLAMNEDEAEKKAQDRWNTALKNGLTHYYQIGEQEIETGNIYDITTTDDPFNP